MLLKIKVHGEGAVTACKSDATWYQRVHAAFLSPKVEYVAGSEDGRQGDDSLYHIGAIEARLVVCGAIREGNRKEPLFCDPVVDGQGDPFKSDRNVYGRDVADVHESMEIASDADI